MGKLMAHKYHTIFSATAFGSKTICSTIQHYMLCSQPLIRFSKPRDTQRRCTLVKICWLSILCMSQTRYAGISYVEGIVFFIAEDILIVCLLYLSYMLLQPTLDTVDVDERVIPRRTFCYRRGRAVNAA